jgi:hypothetical protein
LKIIGAAALAAVPFAGGGLWSGLLAAAATGATLLSVDLPRDQWTLEEKARRRRANTRSNPLTPGVHDERRR